MSPYLLHCTVCFKKFGERKKWTEHLFQEDHQKKARCECGKWEETKKECALVTFVSRPVNQGINEEEGDGGSSNLGVLLRKYLENLEGGLSLPMTDFIWWRERPTMAILQFESREKANQVYTEIMKVESATEQPVKIGNRFVSFRKLVDLLQLEWNIPDGIQHHPSPQPSTSQGSPPVKRRKITASSSCSSDDLVYSNENDKLPNATIMPPTSSALIAQFNTLLKTVEIRPSEIQQATQIIEQVKTLIASEYPTCQVFLFRHFYLKIRNPFCNDLLIFIYVSSSTSSQGYQKLVINQVAEKLLIDKDPSLMFINKGHPKYKDSQQFQFVSCTRSRPLSNFWIFTDPVYLLEVQLNRLLKYMLTFDPKCSLVLSCVHYFCTLNSCYFGDSPSKGEAVEWLLIFFLSKEKKIPTVRQILDQPHQPIMLPNSTIDIGFNPDPDFATKWKKDRGTHKIMKKFTEIFVCGVLKLFKRFLRFVGRILPKGNFILNIRDAENQNRTQVLCQPRTKWASKLTNEEIDIIKSNPAHDGRKNKRPFSIVHPLVVHLSLGYKIEEFEFASKVMKRGVFHLNRFLHQRDQKYLDRWVKKKGKLPEIYKDLESALKIEDVHKKTFKNGKNRGKNKGKGGKNKKAKQGKKKNN